MLPVDALRSQRRAAPEAVREVSLVIAAKKPGLPHRAIRAKGWPDIAALARRCSRRGTVCHTSRVGVERARPDTHTRVLIRFRSPAQGVDGA
jgi:hypothetical protein